ncbi:MAG: hypothetical protein ACHQT8_06465 [Chlamydiales bacterium]
MLLSRMVFALLALAPLVSHAGGDQEMPEEFFFSIGSEKTEFPATYQGGTVTNYPYATIQLSDGSQWIIKDKTVDEAALEISENWNLGDDIRIQFDLENGEFALRSVQSPLLFHVELDTSCISNTAYCIDSIDENGYAIVTNDASEWAVGWLGSVTTQHWQPGDRVIINKSIFSRGEDYIMINLTREQAPCWVSLITWK